jgi:hypothetical protein
LTSFIITHKEERVDEWMDGWMVDENGNVGAIEYV